MVCRTFFGVALAITQLAAGPPDKKLRPGLLNCHLQTNYKTPWVNFGLNEACNAAKPEILIQFNTFATASDGAGVSRAWPHITEPKQDTFPKI